MRHGPVWWMVPTLLTALGLAACGGGPGSDETAAVSFTQPADGATVSGPVRVTMDATNFVIEPAGEVRGGAGHFHIMVDTDCVIPGQPIPSDETHLHYGQAQTIAELTLSPGQHTLCLQAGDGAHTALDLTDEITITVR